MSERDVIDITLDGRVIQPAPAGVSASTKLLAFVILAAVAAGVGAAAFLVIGIALILVPVAIGAAGLAWLLWKLRLLDHRAD